MSSRFTRALSFRQFLSLLKIYRFTPSCPSPLVLTSFYSPSSISTLRRLYLWHDRVPDFRVPAFQVLYSGERTFSALALFKTYLPNRTNEKWPNDLVYLHFNSTIPVAIVDAVDRFAGMEISQWFCNSLKRFWNEAYYFRSHDWLMSWKQDTELFNQKFHYISIIKIQLF